MSAFEELLARDGRLVYKTRGVSMEPMLRQNRDLVTVVPPAGRLKKYDVALYRSRDRYVLHRVIAVEPDRYLIRGDNTFALEAVPEEAVLGVLTAFVRRGKPHSADEPGYLAYVRFWDAIYPLRAFFHRCFRALVELLRRLGLLPYVKKLLRR